MIRRYSSPVPHLWAILATAVATLLNTVAATGNTFVFSLPPVTDLTPGQDPGIGTPIETGRGHTHSPRFHCWTRDYSPSRSVSPRLYWSNSLSTVKLVQRGRSTVAKRGFHELLARAELNESESSRQQHDRAYDNLDMHYHKDCAKTMEHIHKKLGDPTNGPVFLGVPADTSAKTMSNNPFFFAGALTKALGSIQGGL
ncbi:unnamed protein product [Choristocarpus tenellus]